MKSLTNIKLLSTIILAICTLSSCLKDDIVTLEESYVEWDAAVYNANGGGRTYPIIQRVPRGGEPVNNADPVISSNSGTISFRVNLVGPHRSTDTEFTFSAVSGEALPASHIDAIAGTHYTTTGTVVIPANSSFGEAQITLLPGTAGNRGFAVFEIQGTEDIRVMEREKRIAISFARVAP